MLRSPVPIAVQHFRPVSEIFLARIYCLHCASAWQSVQQHSKTGLKPGSIFNSRNVGIHATVNSQSMCVCWRILRNLIQTMHFVALLGCGNPHIAEACRGRFATIDVLFCWVLKTLSHTALLALPIFMLGVLARCTVSLCARYSHNMRTPYGNAGRNAAIPQEGDASERCAAKSRERGASLTTANVAGVAFVGFLRPVRDS